MRIPKLSAFEKVEQIRKNHKKVESEEEVPLENKGPSEQWEACLHSFRSDDIWCRKAHEKTTLPDPYQDMSSEHFCLNTSLILVLLRFRCQTWEEGLDHGRRQQIGQFLHESIFIIINQWQKIGGMAL